MPYYDFYCDTCGKYVAKKVPRKDCTKTLCPNCGNHLRVAIHPVPFIFKEKN